MTAADRDTHELQRALDLAGLDAAPMMTLGKCAENFLASDWLAGRDRRVAAQTLRDAADDKERRAADFADLPIEASRYLIVARWLRDRADTTEGTHHDEG